MRFIVLSTLICLLFYACHQPSATNSTDTQTLTLPTETSDSFFSNHFQLETIIPLETNDTFLISQPKKGNPYLYRHICVVHLRKPGGSD